MTRPSDCQQNRTNRKIGFAVPVNHRVNQKESEKRNKYQDLTRELIKTIEQVDGDTNCNWCTRNSHQWTGTGTGGIINKRTSGDHPNNSTVEIGQNIEKSLRDLRRLAVTHIPEESYQS